MSCNKNEVDEIEAKSEQRRKALEAIRDDIRQLTTATNTPPAKTLDDRLDQVTRQYYEAGTAKGHQQAAEVARAALSKTHEGICSPGTCGHQPATKHVDCDDPWHKTPSPEAAFSCSTCGAS